MGKMKKSGAVKSYYQHPLEFVKYLSLFIFLGIAHLQADNLVVQKQLISLKIENKTIAEAFSEIKSKSGYVFFYSANVIDVNKRVSIKVKNQTIENVLDKLLDKSHITYIISGNKVYIKAKDNGVQQVPKAKGKKRIVITGNVTDIKDEPLIGVSIYEKENPNNGTITDMNGNYSISLEDPESTVVFKYIGFITKQEAVAKRKVINISMAEDVGQLDEVVVVGFGKQKKESLVGAVEAIKPSDLTVTSSNFTTSFAGKIAGLISVQKTGMPGADGANFWIRGISTFGSNASPLLILDGVEINSEMLGSIAPETVESFSVLKDATATALYGSRGANGVLIITTKSGKDSERMNVNVRVETGISMPTNIQKIADGVEYMNAYNEARHNYGLDNYYSEEKIQGTKNKINPYVFPNNEWYDMLFKSNSFNQNVNINVTGGGKRVDYFLNASFFNETGILRETSTGRFNTNAMSRKYMFQSNVSAQITPTTRIGVKINSQLQYRTLPYVDANDLFYYTMRANPVDFPAYYPSDIIGIDDGNTYYGNAPSWDGAATQINPLAYLDMGYKKYYLSYLTSIFNLDQDLKFITKGLHFKFLVSFYNKTWSDQERYFSPFYKKLNGYTVNEDNTFALDLQDIGTAGTSYLSYDVSKTGYREYSMQGTLDWSRNFNDTHDLNALLVYHMREQVDNAMSSDENTLLPTREQGFAGRLTYGYKNRYLAEINFGYNGSENFAKGHRWGFFPSYAVGWVISNEPFFEKMKKTISLLKIRASYGKSGNDELGARFPYLTTVNTNSSTNLRIGVNREGQSGSTLTSIGNENATWEVSKKTNIGLELGFFNDLTLVIDFFKENRTGIFMKRRTIPTTAGYEGTTPYANIGAVKNKGIDATLVYNKAINKDFIVSFRGAFTYAHNEITAQDEPKLIYPYMSRLGHPVNTIMGLISEGLYKDQSDVDNSSKSEFEDVVHPGDIKYKDLNDDKKVNGNDITAIGNPTVPEIVYGFGPSIKYKHMDFSFYFQGIAKISLLMSSHHPFNNGTNSGFNLSKWIVDDHWSESNPNPNAAYPRLAYSFNLHNTQTSTFWAKNAAFLRLKSAELGYTLKGFRFYLTGTNLLTFSKFHYWDPELGSGNGLSYPLQRTYNLGIQYNF
jgi:TonB-linked SusC/RagA family outer membrane protein